MNVETRRSHKLAPSVRSPDAGRAAASRGFANKSHPGLFSLLAFPELFHDKFGVPRRPIVVSMTELLLVLAVSLFRLS